MDGASAIPNSAARVPRHTADALNERIRRRVEGSLAYHERHTHHIDDRLRELDREWDIERQIEANAATLAAAGSLLGALVDKRFLVLPLVVGTFLLQHAVQGWCPPVPIFRRLLSRTPQEIEAERYALKALRGDFGQIPSSADPVSWALNAVGRWSDGGGEGAIASNGLGGADQPSPRAVPSHGETPRTTEAA